MRLGYTCLPIGTLNTELRTCRIKNAREKRLKELIEHNLQVLENMIDYNIANQIKVFRVCSDVIPYASNPINSLEWWKLYGDSLNKLGQKVKSADLRLTMHTGPQAILNAKDKKIREQTIEELLSQARLFDAMGLDDSHKLVMPVGGIFRNRKKAITRFRQTYQDLEETLKKRLVIENDLKCYNIEEVLEIGRELKIPVVFERLAHELNPAGKIKTDLEWIMAAKPGWELKDGNQLITYSVQDEGKKPGFYSGTVGLEDFLKFVEPLKEENCDILLESQDKNLSVLKCMNGLDINLKSVILTEEWRKYEYAVLEGSPVNYLEIRKLLRNQDENSVIKFYTLIEEALLDVPTLGNAINVAQHIWGDFRNLANAQEKKYFLKLIQRYEQGEIPLKTVKNDLWKLVIKYEQDYLKDIYYFVI
ncbi:UV DNA damage repair endonuclease UvsE [Eubacteriaceae bacterium ES3]|nr:UV DNA damage repair endonuclease UvsE [Eubacteriaceae bacterium ES3]